MIKKVKREKKLHVQKAAIKGSGQNDHLVADSVVRQVSDHTTTCTGEIYCRCVVPQACTFLAGAAT